METVVDTRERILDAALDSFAEQGYAGASMRNIAARAGLRASSLYNHFAGKKQLLLALLERTGPVRMTEELAALPENLSMDGLRDRVFDALFALWRDPKEARMMRFLCGEAVHNRELGAMLERQIYGLERERLAGALARLWGNDPEAHDRAAQWAALSVSLAFGQRFRLMLGSGSAQEVEQVCRETRELFQLLGSHWS